MSKLRNLVYRVAQNPLVVKAFNTFWQAFLAVWLVSGFRLDKVTLIAAAAAGLSAAKTFVVARVKG